MSTVVERLDEIIARLSKEPPFLAYHNVLELRLDVAYLAELIRKEYEV